MISLLPFDCLTLAFWSPGPAEMMVLAVVALLLYGGNLPEVARSWGKTFAEFRRSLTGFQSEMNNVIYSEPEKLAYHEDSSYSDGYEEPDAYQDDSQDDSQKEQDDSQKEIDESEITVNDAGKETIVIEDEQEADKKIEAEPAD